jgi:hypothetical protein
MNNPSRPVRVVAVALAVLASGLAELNDRLSPPLDHPAIEYFNYLKHPPHDVAADLRREMDAGQVQLKFDPDQGYLPALLDALHVPVESHMAVFSRTSLQQELISPSNPRNIFFNDRVSVAWVRGGFIEMAALDPTQGVNFYTLEQQRVAQPSFTRRDDCLRCHRSDESLGVPGYIVRSFFTLPDGSPKLILGAFSTDHRSPFEERWGGWYVTGSIEHAHHMGNAVLTDPDHPDSFTAPQDAPHNPGAPSSIVALLVFDHQMHMANLITRVGWEVRCALFDKMPPREFDALLRQSAEELADYLLFIDEAPLPGPVHTSGAFAETFAGTFAAQGPRDSRGRSLRDFDLKTRLFRYPCSYMIYSAAFDSLPAPAKAAIYTRLWQVLSGQVRDPRYARLAPADRAAILEILRETKPDLARWPTAPPSITPASIKPPPAGH